MGLWAHLQDPILFIILGFFSFLYTLSLELKPDFLVFLYHQKISLTVLPWNYPLTLTWRCLVDWWPIKCSQEVIPLNSGSICPHQDFWNIMVKMGPISFSHVVYCWAMLPSACSVGMIISIFHLHARVRGLGQQRIHSCSHPLFQEMEKLPMSSLASSQLDWWGNYSLVWNAKVAAENHTQSQACIFFSRENCPLVHVRLKTPFQQIVNIVKLWLLLLLFCMPSFIYFNLLINYWLLLPILPPPHPSKKETEAEKFWERSYSALLALAALPYVRVRIKKHWWLT